jgi:hypothetical protein
MSHFAHLKELTTKGVGLAVVQDIAAVEGGERIGAYLGENSSSGRSHNRSRNRSRNRVVSGSSISFISVLKL